MLSASSNHQHTTTAKGIKRALHRQLSDVSTITYSGYLLKRSNSPRVTSNTLTPFPSSASYDEDEAYIEVVDNHHSKLGDGHASDDSTHRRRRQPQPLRLKPKPAAMPNNDYYFSQRQEQQRRQPLSLDLPQHFGKLEKETTISTVDQNSMASETKSLQPDTENTMDGESVAFSNVFFGVDLEAMVVSSSKQSNETTVKNSDSSLGGVDVPSLSSPSTTRYSSAPIAMARTPSSTSGKSSGIATNSTNGDTSTRSKAISLHKSNSDNAVALARDGGGATSNVPSDVLGADGYLWRAKFCVLEGGVLYFYRFQSDAETPEAHAERQQHYTQLDLGNGGNGLTDSPSSSTHSNGGSFAFRGSGLSNSPVARPLEAELEYFASAINTAASRSEHSWEKFVALDSVGAVRSAEVEYGANSFELSSADDVAEKLILRAQSQDEMNEWLFQFHRQIASYILDIMECAKSSRVPAITTPEIGEIHHPSFSIRSSSSQLGASPDSAHRISNLAASFSPRFFFGARGFNTTPALSHGHGRNSLHRRRVGASGSSSDSQRPGGVRMASSFQDVVSPISQFPPMPTPQRRIEPPEAAPYPPNRDLTPELSAPESDYPEMERPLPTRQTGKYVPPHLRNKAPSADATTPVTASTAFSPIAPSSGVDTAASASSASTGSATAGSRGMYMPPHLRNKTSSAASGGSKYVPPHLRNAERPSTPQDKYVPAHLYNSDPSSPFVQSPAFAADEELELIGASGGGSGIGPVAPFEDEPETFDEDDEHHNVKLGGCADPKLVSGSITDDIFIPRKASRVGKVRTTPFGYHRKGAKESSGSVKPLFWEIGAVSECGVRDSNEDSYLIVGDLLEAFEESHNMRHQGAAEIPAKPTTLWENTNASHTPGLFAVFDGHCGDHAARFAAENLIQYILDKSVHEDGFNAMGQDGGIASRGSDHFQRVLDEALSSIDRSFCHLCVQEGREWESGATALIAALVEEHLVIANLGDARGVLCRSVANDSEDVEAMEAAGWTELPSDDFKGSQRCLWKQVTDVHSPSREDERERIEKANGWITTEKEIPVGQLQRMVLFDQDVVDILMRCFADRYQPKASAPQRILHISRVCGELAVSRALGDRDFKAAFNAPRRVTSEDGDTDGEIQEWDSSLCLPYPENHSGSFVGDLVSNKAEFQSIRIGEPGVSEEFLLLACDGLWDVMDADDAVRLTRDLLFEKKWPAKRAANRLAELAVHLGSSDNITVIVVRFFERE